MVLSAQMSIFLNLIAEESREHDRGSDHEHTGSHNHEYLLDDTFLAGIHLDEDL